MLDLEVYLLFACVQSRFAALIQHVRACGCCGGDQLVSSSVLQMEAEKLRREVKPQ
jgi:hypothetical protein